MERKIATEVKVGVFVLAALALLMGTIFALSSSRQLFRETYTIYAAFGEVQGLVVGAPVRLSGVTVGRVAGVEFVRQEGDKNIRVRLELDKGTSRWVRKDSMASIQTVGLLGDKYLELTTGTPASPELAHMDYVAVREPTDFYAFLEKGNVIMDNTIKISRSLNAILGGVTQQEVQDDFRHTLHSVKAILKEVEQGQGLLHSLIYAPPGKGTAQLSATLGSIDEAAGSFSRLSKRMDRVVGQLEEGRGVLHQLIYPPGPDSRSDLTGAIASIQKAGSALSDMSEGVSAITSEIRAGRGLLHELIYQPSELRLRELNRAARSTRAAADNLARLGDDLNDMVIAVKKGDGLLHSLIYEEKSELINNAAEASRSVKELLETVKSGQGTLGRLIYGREDKNLFVRLEGLVADLEELTSAIREGDGLLHKVIYDRKAAKISDDIADTARLLKNSLQEIREGEGVLSALLFSPRGEETLKEWRTIVTNLARVTSRLEQGEGSIGGLIQDPSVYEDIKAIVSGARRSGLVKFLIRFVGEKEGISLEREMIN